MDCIVAAFALFRNAIRKLLQKNKQIAWDHSAFIDNREQEDRVFAYSQTWRIL